MSKLVTILNLMVFLFGPLAGAKGTEGGGGSLELLWSARGYEAIDIAEKSDLKEFEGLNFKAMKVALDTVYIRIDSQIEITAPDGKIDEKDYKNTKEESGVLVHSISPDYIKLPKISQLAITFHEILAFTPSPIRGDKAAEINSYRYSALFRNYLQANPQVLSNVQLSSDVPVLLDQLKFDPIVREGFRSYDEVMDYCERRITMHQGQYLIVYCSILQKEWKEWALKLSYLTDYRFMGYAESETYDSELYHEEEHENFNQSSSSSRSSRSFAETQESVLRNSSSCNSCSKTKSAVALKRSASAGISNRSSSYRSMSYELDQILHYEGEDYDRHVAPVTKSVAIPYHHFEEQVHTAYGIKVFGIGKLSELPWRVMYSSLELLDGIISVTFDSKKEAMVACKKSLLEGRTEKAGKTEHSRFQLQDAKCFVQQNADGKYYYELKTRNPFLDL